MKKYRIAIEGLLFKDFSNTFSEMVIDNINKINLNAVKNPEKLTDALKEALENYEDTLSTFYLDSHKFKVEEYMKSLHCRQRKIVEKHRNSFTHFLLYISVCKMIYEKIIDTLKDDPVQLSTTQVLALTLYGICIRRASKISELLISGYVDGAMIIWRSLYENAVILLTLVLNDSNELSQRFIDHSNMNSHKKMKSYEDTRQDFNFPSLPNDIQEDVHDKKEELIQKYGKDFVKNAYGWADILFSRKANFRDIESKIDLCKYRTYYIICSEQIHSSFNGINRFMENGKINLSKLMSNEYELGSFVDPMQFTIGVLHEINDYIIWECSTKDEINANILFVNKLFQRLLNTFNNDKIIPTYSQPGRTGPEN